MAQEHLTPVKELPGDALAKKWYQLKDMVWAKYDDCADDVKLVLDPKKGVEYGGWFLKLTFSPKYGPNVYRSTLEQHNAWLKSKGWDKSGENKSQAPKQSSPTMESTVSNIRPASEQDQQQQQQQQNIVEILIVLHEEQLDAEVKSVQENLKAGYMIKNFHSVGKNSVVHLIKHLS